jgi:hypothetical protein
MVGKKVRVFWPVDESWYTGIVQEFDSETGQHLLCYNDGDTEWVKIGENTPGAVLVGTAAGGAAEKAAETETDAVATTGGGLEQIESPERNRLPADGMMQPDMGPAGDHGFPGGGHFPPMPFGAMPPGMVPYGQYSQFPAMYSPHFSGPGGPAGTSPLRSRPGVEDAFGQVEDPGGTKRKAGPKPWAKDEDSLLLNLVQNMRMPMKWSIVAQSLPERTGKQCRERYVNHLNPRLKTSDWNAVEDTTIFHLYGSMGSHWAKMSKVIPGRTDNGIKNRFHNLRRQYQREDEHRLKLSSDSDFPDDIRLDRLRKFPEHLKNKSLSDLWDIQAGLGVLAAQSILGNIGNSRTSTYFGPFREADAGEMCGRCGFLLPSVHTGSEICTKTGWCQSCTRVPPHLADGLLRECLNLRRAEDKDKREIIESWEEYFLKKEGDDEPAPNKEDAKGSKKRTSKKVSTS